MTFPGYEFLEGPPSPRSNCVSATGVASLECDWEAALRLVYKAYEKDEPSEKAESALLAVSRNAQEIMSSAASNYDLPRLLIGSTLAGIAVILSLVASFRTLSTTPGASAMFFIFTVVGYGIMMFASSYVEEEQQFWYWISSGWIIYLHGKS